MPPFTVAAPSGARIRDRLRVDGEDEQVLTLVGQHLGRHQRADVAERIAIGQVVARFRDHAAPVVGVRVQRRLAVVEQRIAEGRPAVVAGGRRLLRARHHLAEAGLSPAQWRKRWEAARLFLTADGESGAPHGNYTIRVDPADGSVTIVLPEPLRHLANAPSGHYRLGCVVAFSHLRQEWLDRVTANRAVRYDILYDPARDRWYLDASWATDTTVPPTPHEIRAARARLLAVDLNADHLAACVLDPHGNPIGRPVTVPMDLTGPASTRDGRLRAAITAVAALAEEHGCAGIVIENLGFTDARTTGRETMGRGPRGKRFRRTVTGIPTARFRERLRGIAYHRGLGHRIRRRPGVTADDQRIVVRRATGQTGPGPRPRGTTSPPGQRARPTRAVGPGGTEMTSSCCSPYPRPFGVHRRQMSHTWPGIR